MKGRLPKISHLPMLLLFVTFSQRAYSNDHFFPGYYIDNKGDSVPCKIEYNDWNKNPNTIVVEVNNTQKTLGPGDIKGFGVTGYADYRSATISYHPGPLQGSDLPEEFSDKIETKDCFLLVLVDGPYSLYELSLAERYYFFISEQNNPPKELIYRAKQFEMAISEDEQYKNLLGQYMIQEHLWDQESYSIKRLTYSPTKLTAVVIRLNEAHSGKKATLTTKAKTRARVIQLDIFGGGVLNSFPTEFATNFASAKFPSTFSPAGGLAFRIVFPGHFNAFSLGLEAGYSIFKSNTTISGTTQVGVLSSTWYSQANYKENLSVSNSLFMTNFYFMYLLPGSGKVRYYGKLGLNAEFLLKSGGNVYSNWSASYTDYHSFNPPYSGGSNSGTYEAVTFGSGSLSADIAVGGQAGRHKVEIAYNSPMNCGGLGQPTFKMSSFGVYYFFTILK
jgi:hypothetical protein